MARKVGGAITHGRVMRRSLLVVAVSAVLALGAGGVAWGGQGTQGKGPLYHNFTQGNCPQFAPPGSSGAEGFVIVERLGGTLQVTVHLKHAVPDVTYTIDYNCHAVLGTITTNSNGVANAVYEVTPPAGATTFSFDAHAGSFVPPAGWSIDNLLTPLITA